MAGLLGVLGGCSDFTYYADVPKPEPAIEPKQQSPESEWTVKQGDTLYSIAFSLGLDWRDVAAANGISAPYTIYPGQRVRVERMASAQETAPDSVESAPQPLSAARTQAAPEPEPVAVQAQAATAPPALAPVPVPGSAPRPAVTSAPAMASIATATTDTVSAPVPATTPATVPEPVSPVAMKSGWNWPAKGKLVRRFSGGAQPHKGVDFAGNIGDPVLAANGGTVVYAGSGVRGYGNLLIVKHDAQYLSAYAHNSRLLVKEGDAVDSGQKIAEIGDSGTDRVKLHFELRRQGTPVDPVQVLPKR